MLLINPLAAGIVLRTTLYANSCYRKLTLSKHHAMHVNVFMFLYSLMSCFPKPAMSFK